MISKTEGSEMDFLEICHCGDKLATPFNPAWLYEWPKNGRLYYPASKELGGVGLVKSSLAEQLSGHFIFEQSIPTAIQWKGNYVKLDDFNLESLLNS